MNIKLSETLANWFEELTHLKRPWCWERLKVGGEGDDRGWDGWMASPIQWMWIWIISGSWWWTGRPGVLQSVGLQTVGHDWATELNWDHLGHLIVFSFNSSKNKWVFCLSVKSSTRTLRIYLIWFWSEIELHLNIYFKSFLRQHFWMLLH